MRAMAAAFAAAALSGCAAIDVETPTAAARYRIEACSEQVAIVPVDAAAATALAPEGFHPVAFDASGRAAAAVVAAFACRGASQLIGLVALEPPPEFATPEVGVHGVPFAWWLDGVAPPVFDGWAWPEAGTVSVAADVDAGARVGRARAEGTGASLASTTSVAGPTEEDGPLAVRLYRVGDGAVRGWALTSVTARTTTPSGIGDVETHGLDALFPTGRSAGGAFHSTGLSFEASYEARETDAHNA